MQIKMDKKERIESEILGAMIYYPSLIDIAQNILMPNNFSTNYRKIFIILCEINKNEKTSSNLILDYFKESEFDIRDLISIGSEQTENEYLFEQKLKRLSDLNLAIIGENKLKASLERFKMTEQGLDEMIELKNDIDLILEIKERFYKEKNFAESLPEIIERMENERKGLGDSLTSLHFPSFNHCTKGLLPGNLCTIAGAWKAGKTTFALNLILDISFKNDIPIGIFSLEMTKIEIERKILSMYTETDYGKIRDPKSLTDIEFEQLKQSAIKKFSNSKIYLNNKILNSENEIRSITKQWIKKFGVKIILIDYIGLIKTAQRNKNLENRERELSHISQFLKHFAMELHIPIISVAQLNRQGLINPSSENLAESIGIARDSDFIFTIYKPLKNNEIKIDDKIIPIKENYFVVKLADSRHTQSGKQFILEIVNGSFRELATEYLIF